MNHKRKKARVNSRHGGGCFAKGSRKGEASPSYWDTLYHSRPRRRRDKANCTRIMHGTHPDSIAWDLGNRKPHEYYW
jgi:hypothetical protein